MSDLPPGWRRAPLAGLAEIQGGIQKQPKRAPKSNRFPFLRVANVTAVGLDLHDVHEIELFGDELERLRLASGDLLVVEGNGSPSQIGRAAVWDGSIRDCVHQNHLIRVRPGPDLLPKYLGLLWNSPAIRDELAAVSSSTSGLHTLSVAKLKRIELPVPPLNEQGHIIDILEGYLSRLDNAQSLVKKASLRERSLTRAALEWLVPLDSPSGWTMSTVADAGEVKLGRQRHPDWHSGPEMRPYLRVANVYENRIDTSDVKQMDFSGVFERYRLVVGDVLLNEGQSPEFLGRPAIYRGDPPDVAYTNTLIRFRASSHVLSEWALLVFRRHMHSGRFIRESRITTNIGHLSLARLRSVEFPIPPLSEQRRRVALAKELLSGVDRIRSEGAVITRRSNGLRSSLFGAAFSGKLTRRVPLEDEFGVLSGV